MSAIVDGKALAEDLARSLRTRAASTRSTMAIISVAPNFATLKYLAIKERFAASIGAILERAELDAQSTTEDVVNAIKRASGAHGVVLQLPFPPHIELERVLAHLPAHQDIDMIGTAARAAFEEGSTDMLPPVVGALAEIVERYGVALQRARVVVIGSGRLVGAPTAIWARRMGAEVTTVGKDDAIANLLHSADVIVSGAGVPGLITADMLAPGVVVLDAGTSEDGGRLAGDAHESCREVASLITPVPGGIGPVAVAKLFENLIQSAEESVGLNRTELV